MILAIGNITAPAPDIMPNRVNIIPNSGAIAGNVMSAAKKKIDLT
jgi:hypothetical protein